MGNKYTWVAFNLLASIGLLAWIISWGYGVDEESLTPLLAAIYLLFLGTALFWLYRSIMYWRACIQADDEVFDSIVKDMNVKDMEE